MFVKIRAQREMARHNEPWNVRAIRVCGGEVRRGPRRLGASEDGGRAWVEVEHDEVNEAEIEGVPTVRHRYITHTYIQCHTYITYVTYIHTYIHTYIMIARRPEISQNVLIDGGKCQSVQDMPLTCISSRRGGGLYH
jgi:hypothetical protein